MRYPKGMLNLSDKLENFPVSELNGPGLRYTLWVQGCSLRCTQNCINPEKLDHLAKVLLPVEEIASYLIELKEQRNIEGVTFLGGEPFDQAKALAELGQMVKEKGLSIVTYSGYTLKYIRSRDQVDWQMLLGVTDILIDGPFIDSQQSEELHWRGSRNQQIHFLSDFYDPKILVRSVQKGVNIILNPDGTLNISGLQEKYKLEKFLQRLTEAGIIADS
jgi:anaerobic ribonucleoside-triphosphate reductase activating protein